MALVQIGIKTLPAFSSPLFHGLSPKWAIPLYRPVSERSPGSCNLISGEMVNVERGIICQAVDP